MLALQRWLVSAATIEIMEDKWVHVEAVRHELLDYRFGGDELSGERCPKSVWPGNR